MATVGELWAWISPRLQELAAERTGDRTKPWPELRAGFVAQTGQYPFAEDLPMINIAVDVAGGGANVLNGANGVQIVWPGHGIWTVVLGIPVGAGPVVGAQYDINAPAHASGNRTFVGLVDASSAYLFR